MLALIYQTVNAGDEFSYQKWNIFQIARNIDRGMYTLTILLAYRILFSLKRVEIQMNDKYNTIDQILMALKKQFCIEKITLAFYTVSYLVTAQAIFWIYYWYSLKSEII